MIDQHQLVGMRRHEHSDSDYCRSFPPDGERSALSKPDQPGFRGRAEKYRNNQYERSGTSVVGSFAAAFLLVAVLVVASHPFTIAAFGLVAVGIGVTLRALWRRMTSDGVALPGTTARLCVDSRQGDDTRWSLTVALVD